LFQVLIFEGNPEKFFELVNKNKFFGKRENGNYSNQHKLNNPFNYIAKNSINNTKNSFSIQRMYEGKYNNNQNSSKEFIAKNRINNTKNPFSIQRIYEGKYNNNNPIKFNDFSEVEQQKLMFLMLLKQNHIHRRRHYETIKKFIDEGPTEKELTAAKQNLVGGFPLRLDSNAKIVDYLSMIAFYKLPISYIDNYISEINKVTIDQIKMAFKSKIDPNKLTTIIVGAE
jgi:predicted Zn-dependent peptidase